MTSQHSVVFAEPVRTAIGTFGGSLKDVPAPNLGAVAIAPQSPANRLRPDEAETVVMGNVVQAGPKMNPVCVPKTSSVLIAGPNRLNVSGDDRAALLLPDPVRLARRRGRS